MAKRNRRGGAADDFDDDPIQDADSATGAGSDAVDDRGDDRDDDRPAAKGGGAEAGARSTASATRLSTLGKPGRFVREVVAELRKVIWPTRKELVTYAVVVVFFIAVMMTIIAGYDYGFARAVQWVFGS